jgi:hypothetical protein
MAEPSGVVIRCLNDYPKLVKDFNIARVAYGCNSRPLVKPPNPL